MAVRNSVIHKGSDHAVAFTGKHRAKSPVISRSARGVQRNQVAVTSTAVAKESSHLENSAIQSANLQQRISHLIECEITRVAEQYPLLLRRNSANDHHIPDMQSIASSFSKDSAFDRSMPHPNISQQDRQFLRYTIRAVGFVLGMRSAQSGGFRNVRHQVREVAEILANAIEQRDRASGRTQLCFSSLLPV